MSNLELISNALEKLEQVKVDNSRRIDANDQFFCENQERLYRESVDLFVPVRNQMKAMFDKYQSDGHRKNGYIDQDNDIGHMTERIQKFKEDHIMKICRYFEKKYNVSLNKDAIRVKYADREVTYETVLDEIFVELGGFNFTEKATKEIKDAMYAIAHNRNGCKVKVKGSRMTLEQTYILRYDSIWRRDELSHDEALKIFKALSHFDMGVTEAHSLLTNHYIRYGQDRYGSYMTEKHEIAFTKVKAIKFFKNGRSDIEFTSGEAAMKFAQEYCGYIAATQSA